MRTLPERNGVERTDQREEDEAVAEDDGLAAVVPPNIRLPVPIAAVRQVHEGVPVEVILGDVDGGHLAALCVPALDGGLGAAAAGDGDLRQIEEQGRQTVILELHFLLEVRVGLGQDPVHDQHVLTVLLRVTVEGRELAALGVAVLHHEFQNVLDK